MSIKWGDIFGLIRFLEHSAECRTKSTSATKMKIIGIASLRQLRHTSTSPVPITAILCSLLIATIAHTNAEAFHWQWLNPKPQGNRLNSCTYGSAGYVAVGQLGALCHSSNGIDWTEHHLDSSEELFSVVYSTDRYAAVGNSGRVWVSQDGTQWSVAHSGPLPYLRLRYINGLYWALGGSQIASSRDLLNWQVITLSNIGLSAVHDIAYGKDKFVAVGIAGTILSSSDGVVWSKRISTVTTHLNTIAYGNSLYLAAGDDGVVLTSTNGTVWTNVTDTIPHRHGVVLMFDVVYSDGRFLLTSTDGVILSTTNGTQWRTNVPATTHALLGITKGSNGYCAVGERGTILSSVDGAHSIESTHTFSRAHFTDVASHNGKAIALDESGSPLISDNGWNWRPFTTRLSATRVRIRDGVYWLTGQGASFGNDLSSLRSCNVRNVLDACFGNDAFVAIGRWNAYSGHIQASSDAWTWVTGYVSTNRLLTAATYGHQTFVAVGQSGTIVTSPDGLRWTQQSSNTKANLNDIVFANGVFVIVGDQGNVFISTDGYKWTWYSSGVVEDIEHVSLNEERLTAVTRWEYRQKQRILLSLDGRRWVSSTVPAETVSGASYLKTGELVAVGPNGTILITFLPILTYEEWAEAYFGRVGSQREEIGGRMADPDHDGLANILEYAFDLSPIVPSKDSAPLTAAFDAHDQGTFTVSYRRRKYVLDLSYIIEASTNLVDWTTSGLVASATNDLASAEMVTLRDTYPARGTKRRFFRLSVEE